MQVAIGCAKTITFTEYNSQHSGNRVRMQTALDGQFLMMSSRKFDLFIRTIVMSDNWTIKIAGWVFLTVMLLSL